MKRLIFAILAVLLLTALVTSCEQGMPSTAYSDTPDDVEAWQLKAPRGLQASAYDGYVYLSWEPVANADVYSVYRSIPAQAGVNGEQDTAPQYLGSVDADDVSIYPSRAATVGGGCTYLDYVNLENPMQALTYRYYVAAEREDLTDNEYIEIMFADSELSSAVTVTVGSVPEKGSKLIAPVNVKVHWSPQYDDDFYYVSWDKLPVAQNYRVYYFGEDFEDLFEIYEDEDAAFLYQLVLDEGIPVQLRNTGGYPANHKTDETMAVIDSDQIGDIGPVDTFVVIAEPYDNYFQPSYAGFSNRLTVSDVPDNLEATEDHESEIIVSWDKVYGSNDPANYALFRRTVNDDQWTQLTIEPTRFFDHETNAEQLYYIDTEGLVPGEGSYNYYYYKVRYVYNEIANDTRVSQFSNIDAGAITPLDSPYDVLERPTNVDATDGEFTHKIELTWDSVDNADEYIIYRSEDGSDSYVLLEGPRAFTTMEGDEDRMFYEDNDVEPGIDGYNYYHYYVIAVDTDYDGLGTPLYSEESQSDRGYVLPNETVVVTTTRIAAPTILYQNQGGSASSVAIQWSQVTASGSELAATGYELYASAVNNASQATLIAVVNGNALGSTVTGQNDLAGATIPAVAAAAGAAYDFSITLPTGGFFDQGVDYFFTMKSVHVAPGYTYVSTPSSSTKNWLDGLESADISASTVIPEDTTAEITLRLNVAVTGADSYTLIVSDDSDLNDAAELEEIPLTGDQLSDALTAEGIAIPVTVVLTPETQYWFGLYAEDTDETYESSYSATETFTTTAP